MVSHPHLLLVRLYQVFCGCPGWSKKSWRSQELPVSKIHGGQEGVSWAPAREGRRNWKHLSHLQGCMFQIISYFISIQLHFRYVSNLGGKTSIFSGIIRACGWATLDLKPSPWDYVWSLVSSTQCPSHRLHLNLEKVSRKLVWSIWLHQDRWNNITWSIFVGSMDNFP